LQIVSEVRELRRVAEELHNALARVREEKTGELVWIMPVEPGEPIPPPSSTFYCNCRLVDDLWLQRSAVTEGAVRVCTKF
jgi:hypothetical protein